MGSWYRGVVVFAFCCFLAPDAGAQSILYFNQADDSVAASALNAHGLSFSEVTTPASFDSQLTFLEWDLVIVESACCTFDSAVLVDYVNNGGRAILSYWDLDADASLQTAFDISSTSSFTTPTTINPWVTGSALWNQPNVVSALSASTSSWVDNGDRLTPNFSGYAVGGFTSFSTAGEAGVVIGNEGRTITIGHELDGLSLGPAIDFIENCVVFLLEPRVLVYSDSGSTVARDAVSAEGLSYSLSVGSFGLNDALDKVDWDLAVIDSSLNGLDTTELTQFINAGGQAIVSYWDLDTEPDLQDALGIDAATDFTAPMSISSWDDSPFGELLWSTPNLLDDIPAGADLVFDNGDLLTVGADATAVGGFAVSPTPGQAAVAVTRGGQAITIGHDFSSLDPVAATDFVQNCVHFLLEPPAQILVYSTSIGEHVEDALDRDDYSYRVVSSSNALRSKLRGAIDWDVVVVDNPSTGVPTDALIDYIAAGGQVLLSYWNLDIDTELQLAVGVTTVTEITSPMPISDWPTVTPIWTQPNLVPGLSLNGSDDWFDNGDFMMADAGAEIGGFTPDPLAGAAGVIVSRGGRVVVLGHDLDSVDSQDATDFVHNVVDWFAPLPPENDECANALPLGDDPVLANMATATNDGSASCGASSTNPDVWYTYTALADGTATITTCGTHDTFGQNTGMDTVLTAFDTCGGSQLACNDDTSLCGSLNGSTLRDSAIQLAMVSGQTVLVRVSHFGNSRPGPFFVTAEYDYAPPVNDDCGNATPIGSGSLTGSLFGATNDGFASCGASGSSPDVWYSFTAPASGNLIANTCGSSDLGGIDQGVDSVLAVLDGCGGFELACNDNWTGVAGGACFAQNTGLIRDAAVEVGLAAGQTVLLRVSNVASGTLGQFVLNVEFALPPPANDDCAGAVPVGVGSFLGSLTGATSDGSASCGAVSTPDVWYQYSATQSGALTVTTCGTHDAGGVDAGVDTVLSLYDACGGSELACNDNWTAGPGACGASDLGTVGDAAVEHVVTAGDTVWIRVAAADSVLGPIALTIQFSAAGLPNDDCANASSVGEGTFLGSLAGATNDGSASCGNSNASPDVWYSWTATETGTVTIATCGTHDLGGVDSGVDPVLAVFDGCGGSELGCNDNWPSGGGDACLGSDLGVPGDAAVEVSVVSGQTVVIRLANNVGSPAGSFLLTVSFDAGVAGAFRRGDANDDGGVDISDPVFLLAQLFTAGATTTCDDAADANDDEAIDVADPVFILGALFVTGAPPLPAPTACGVDPSGSGLGCALYTSCP